MAALDEFLTGEKSPKIIFSLDTITILQLSISILFVVVISGLLIGAINKSILK